MKWLTLRQNSIAIIIMTVFLLFFGILAINAATSLRDYPADKSLLATALAQSYPVSIVITLPALMGAFIAAPLISKEIENNTLQLAFTQSITRRKWFWDKFGTLFILIVVVFGLFSLSQHYFYLNAVKLTNPWDWFDIQIVVYMAYVVLAFSLGTLTGLVIGKQVPSMAIFLVLFFLIRFALFKMRAYWFKPLVSTWNFIGENPEYQKGIWVISSRLVDKLGNPVTVGLKQLGCDVLQFQVGDVSSTVEYDCYQRAGLLMEYTYQPIERFLHIQVIEVTITLLISFLAIALMLWILEKRKR